MTRDAASVPARDRYNVPEWSEGYFDVDEQGRLVAVPLRDPARGRIPLPELAQHMMQSGLNLPILVRFSDILHDRVDTLCSAFDTAIAHHGYGGRYTAVYPIKVNQQRTVVEEIIRHGGERVGLEAGSKPELMAVLALARPGSLIICNGYKDRDYIRRALIARRLGLRAVIVIEKPSEVATVIRESAQLGVRPLLGVRVRLASLGTGNWQNTGGEKSKFGLSATQVLTCIRELEVAGLLDCVQLLHFHMGSQMANVRDIRRGLTEAARYFTDLHRLGASLRYVDVGGGLGVDYEGTRSRGACSVNYSVAEYANVVVHVLKETCQAHGLPEPDLITEAGRAMTAHHALLITQVIDSEAPYADAATLAPPPPDAPSLLHDLWNGYTHLADASPVELFHEALHWVSEAQSMYTHGLLDLRERAYAEHLYTALCQGLQGRLDPARRSHREILGQLEEKLAVKYFCNFSLFQSLPDVWAIDQIFPVMPLQRLNEPPTVRGIIEDLTCDSDGCIHQYVDQDGLTPTLALHAVAPQETYLLGFFMIGAYQEILGDMHNLFGDTDAVNVELDGQGGYRLVGPERGDSADQLLSYVHFAPDQLAMAYREKITRAGLEPAQAEAFLAELTAGLYGSTYLQRWP
ncbi:MAG: biosynthetic arginine decarboxylase [Pseudomonadota bacterium]